VIKRYVGLLVLFCSQAGLAAHVSLVPSNAHPRVGEAFSVTVSGSEFPTVFGATLGLTFNDKVISLTGVELTEGSPFTTGVAAKLPFQPGEEINLVGPLQGPLPSGNFPAFRMDFKVLAAGKSSIALVENGGGLMWMDEDRKPIPATYTQASIQAKGNGKKAAKSQPPPKP
jgi:hypothetical protein